MDSALLLRSIVIGFAIAAPVGPIGVLCIRRTLVDGRATGFVSGLGAATADAFYGAVAAFGLTFITNLLVGQLTWLRLAGSLFLCYLGITTLLSRPAERPAAVEGRGLLGAYGSTLLLTLTNPMTILAFAAVIAGMGVVNTGGGAPGGMTIVLGVFVGSALWWLLLSGGVGLLRARIGPGALLWVNRISGAIISAFGLWYGAAALLGVG